ncbi:MAG: hypothetical protein U0744_18040 [Gemmataceae bacterium]
MRSISALVKESAPTPLYFLRVLADEKEQPSHRGHSTHHRIADYGPGRKKIASQA